MKAKTETAIHTASSIVGDAKRHPDDPELNLALEFTRLLNVTARQEALLREAATLFRFYETSHLAKKTQEADEKAYRNAEIAGRIEAALS